MNTFLNDLKSATEQAAKELRKSVVSFEKVRFHREQRQEAQLVAEVYHNLRSNGYSAKDLFMEYLYPPTSINGEQKKLKPDLIFEKSGEDRVVEFCVFWDGDLYVKNSVLNKPAMDKVEKYYEKMRSYSKLKDIVSFGYLVFAFVGPEVFESGKKFNLSEFKRAIDEKIKSIGNHGQNARLPIEVIVG